MPRNEIPDDAVGRTNALDLHHAGAVPRLVRQVDGLGDHTIGVDAGAGEPAARGGQAPGDPGEMEPARTREVACGKPLEALAPLLQGLDAAIGSALIHQQVEHHVLRGHFPGEALNATRCRMNALEQLVEREMPIDAQDDLPIEEEAAGANGREGINQLGK